jgi:glycosyltransferase involved in cell wall biosynthesis
MRIAFNSQIFCMQRVGGVSRYIVSLASQLADAGDEVTIHAPLHQNRYLQTAGSTLSQGRYSSANWPRFYKTWNALLSRRQISAWKPDVVHETYYSRMAAAASNIPAVITVHDLVHELFGGRGFKNDQFSETRRQAIQRADHVICISENTRADLARFVDLPEARVSVVHHGFDRLALTDKAVPGQAAVNQRPFLLFVGKRGGYKNFESLLQAWTNSSKLRAEFDLLAFGGGVFNAEERAMIATTGAREGQIRQVDGGDFALAALYQSASAFVFPSRYEGFGLPSLEAMALSCPVIASNTSCMPEIIGDAGEFFAPTDIEDLQQSIEKVVFSEQFRSDLIERGHKRLAQFSWQRCAEQTRAIYESLQ